MNSITEFANSIKGLITAIAALGVIIIGKKRHVSEKSQITSKEAIAKIVEEMTQSENSATNPKVELIQQYIKAKAKDMSVDDLERALKLI